MDRKKAFFSDGTSSGIILRNISTSGATASFSVSFPSDKNLFYFKDMNLANVICDSLGKVKGQITENDLKGMESLTIPAKDYYDMPYDLSGIENLTGLKTLIANDCGIDNIDMLSTLTNLEHLELNDNYISDISSLSGLTNLKTLKLRGNLIEDYSPATVYYSSLTEKDFSLSDKNDAVFWTPNINSGILGTAYIKYTDTVPNRIYYSIEKHDNITHKLLSRKRGRVSATYGTSKNVNISDKFANDNNAYIILKTYENDTYRNMMSENIIDNAIIDLSLFEEEF